MSQPEWMKKYHQIVGQKGQGSTEESGTTEQVANVLSQKENEEQIDPRSTGTTGSEDAAALFRAAGEAPAVAAPSAQEEEDAAALFQAAGAAAPVASIPVEEESNIDPEPTIDSSVAGVDSTVEAESSTTVDNAQQQQENNAAEQDVGESWVVDQSKISREEDAVPRGPAETEQPDVEVPKPPSAGSVEEEEYYDEEEGDEVYEEEVYVEEGQEREIEDQYFQNEEEAQAAVIAATQSRSAKVAPAPEEFTLPVFNLEEQRKVILSSSKGKRSYMSPAVPIVAFLFLAATILLVVFLVVLRDDDVTRSGPTLAPSMQFLPLEPTSNGNIPSAATTRFDPFQGNCNFALLTQPNVIDQCACSSSVTIVADDINVRRQDLVDDFMQSVFPGWNETVTSCSPENQALLWMSSGINNGGEVGNLLKLQRFALALLYIDQGGTNWRTATNWMTEADVCAWEGVTCNDQSFVRTLRLDRNRLSGPISDAPALLNAIEGYSAVQNGMTGDIPVSFFENDSLQSLDLSFNDLSGAFPRLDQDSNIRLLNLAGNRLSGSIPREVSNAISLESLNIASNTFSGELPDELFDLPLQELAIGGNILEGTIPTQLRSVTTLTSLSLGPNLFEDDIPTFLGDLTNLKRLSIMGIPGLEGRLPAQYGLSLTNLENFVLSETSVGGNIPDQFSGLTALEVLNLSSNALARAIPGSLGQLTKLVTLDLSNNDFTGIVPGSLSSLFLLEELQLHTNSLVGTIPGSFGNLANLRTLTLDGNLMNGRAPDDVCALRDVQLNDFVVDCPTQTSGGQVLGIICSVPDCCTECL
ncbi:RHS repeat-associated core domain containing protein [Nitzschia inconspicua]|uniref:RHS repeat-associated core domain containing protein n=1 Tax=Nitzschia inconspicua TaxID=303405 RepID=A0A9K3LPS9_9STRA|nr:RHS repeat-associated core domain containing protein [Nitzschia inconspicua]